MQPIDRLETLIASYEKKEFCSPSMSRIKQVVTEVLNEIKSSKEPTSKALQNKLELLIPRIYVLTPKTLSFPNKICSMARNFFKSFFSTYKDSATIKQEIIRQFNDLNTSLENPTIKDSKLAITGKLSEKSLNIAQSSIKEKNLDTLTKDLGRGTILTIIYENGIETFAKPDPRYNKTTTQDKAKEAFDCIQKQNSKTEDLMLHFASSQLGGITIFPFLSKNELCEKISKNPQNIIVNLNDNSITIKYKAELAPQNNPEGSLGNYTLEGKVVFDPENLSNSTCTLYIEAI